MTSTLQINLATHGVDAYPTFAGLDSGSIHRAEYWKQYALANGIGGAAVLMSSITCNDKQCLNSLQAVRIAYTRGIREAKATVFLRAKREAEEAAAQVRERNAERNAERNRKKREAKKRLRTARPTAAPPSPVQ